jgi:PKD repeat protein
VITTSGNYWVEVSNENNCILRDTIAIVIVGTAPTALFSASNGCKNTVVAFTDLSSPPLGETISQWLWDFGDGSTSNIQNNTHLFDSAGIYIVSMKVILQSGCGAIFNQSITIFDTPELSYTAFNLCNQNTTVFNNTSNLFGGTLQSVLWNFGDPSSGANAANTNQSSHNYALEGNYNINLKIETVEGCVDSSQWSINIKPSPIADFKFSNVCLGDNTMFTDASEISFPWQNLSRTWIFSNGDTSFIYQPSIVFDSAGTFQVSLQVQSTNGCRDTLIKPVTIYNTPNASLTYQKNCIGDSTLLNDSSTCVNCQITNFSWSINNNFISNNENISYLFPDTGSYNISHMVENNAGCISIIDTNINIVLPPKASFIINSSIGSPPFNAQFTNQSSFANTYTWQFGDGNFSQEVNPTHLYNDTGLFTITLKAFNSDNCMNSISQILNLKPKKIDLLIYELSTETVNEYIEITMVVFNQSTAIISGFESIISNKLNIITKENYINNIKPGEFKTIKLNTKIRQGEGLNLSDVLCIELINIEEGNDINPSNNKACSIITNNDLKLINLFPNPSIDHVSISFICPTNEEVLFEISDVSGKISSRYNYQSKAGYNEFHFSTIELAEGTYNCKLYYKGSAQSLRFVKHKQ